MLPRGKSETLYDDVTLYLIDTHQKINSVRKSSFWE